MKLRKRLDPSGVLWVDNPVVTVRRRWEKYRKFLSPRARGRASSSAWRVLSAVFGILWAALTVYLWLAGELAFDAWTWLLLALSIGLAVYDKRHGRHPLYEPSAPVRVGFSTGEVLWESQDGTVSRKDWSTIESVGIGRDEELSAFARLYGEAPTVLRSLNLDVAIMIRWAHHLAQMASLLPEALDRPLTAQSTGGGMPDGGITLTEAAPPLVLYPDRVVLMKRPMHQAFARDDVDAVRFSLLGKERLIITIQGHQASFIMDPTRTGRFLDWLGKGDLIVSGPGPATRPGS